MSPTEADNLALYRTLGTIEAKVDELLNAEKSQDKRLDDIDRRVSELDQVHAKYIGMAGGIGLVVGVLSPLLHHFLFG